MKDERIERIAEIIAYVLQLVGGELFSKTRLVKLLYLLDVVTSREQDESFTKIAFKSHYYGPYSEDIEEALSLLSHVGSVSTDRCTSVRGNPYYHIKLNSMPDFGHLQDGDRLEVKRRLLPLLDLNLKQLLDVTYRTEEYSEANFGEVIQL